MGKALIAAQDPAAGWLIGQSAQVRGAADGLEVARVFFVSLKGISIQNDRRTTSHQIDDMRRGPWLYRPCLRTTTTS